MAGRINMGRYLARQLCVIAAAIAAGTGCAPDAVKPKSLKHGPLQLALAPPVLGADPQIFQASARGAPADDLFSADATYGLRRGDLKGTLAAQDFGQQLSARLPGASLEVGWQAQQQQTLGTAGVAQTRSQRARLQWTPEPLRLELAASPQPDAAQPCAFDARLQRNFDAGSWTPGELSLRRQSCSRSPGAAQPQTGAWTAAAGWRSEAARSGLSLSRLQSPADNTEADFEFNAEHARQLGAWGLSGALAWRPAGAHSGAPPPLWAGRASLQRSLWRTPVTASWQRSQPQLWSQPVTASAGQETALALDLTPQLHRWLGPALGADLSYRRLRPDDRVLRAEDSLHMGLRFDWW